MSIAWSISVPKETWESATASGHPVGPTLPVFVVESSYYRADFVAAVDDGGAATPPRAANSTSWANIAV